MTAQLMPPDDPMARSGARWCEQHSRWECAAKVGRPHHANAMRGQRYCYNHVGKAKEVARAQGEAKLAAWSLDVASGLAPVDLAERMLALVHMTSLRVEVYAERVRMQYEAEGAAGLVGSTWAVGRGGDPVQTGEQVRGLVKLEQDERKLLATFVKNAHDMGIAEAQVTIAAAQAQYVISAYRGSLEDVPGLLPADKDALLSGFLRRLDQGRGPEALELEAGQVTE